MLLGTLYFQPISLVLDFFLHGRLNAHFDHSNSQLHLIHVAQFHEMRWDKTVARILLIFSFSNFAIAPAIVRQRHLDVAEVASEKRNDPDNEATDESASEATSDYLSEATNFGSDSDRYFSASELPDDSPPETPSGSSHQDSALDSLSGSSHQEWPPTSPAASFHEGSSLNYPQRRPLSWWMSYDQHSASYHDSVPSSPSGSVGSMPALVSDSESPEPVSDSSSGLSHHDWVSAQSESVHVDSSSELSSGSSHEDWSPESPRPAFHEGPAWSQEYPPGWQPENWHWVDDDTASFHGSVPASPPGQDSAPSSPFGSSHHDSTPSSPSGSLPHLGTVGSMPELVSGSKEPVNSPESVSDSSRYHLAPENLDESHYLMTPASGSTSTHDDSVPVSVNPSTLDDSVPELLAASMHNNLAAPLPTDPSTHDDLAPESGAPPLHDAPPPESGFTSSHSDFVPVLGNPSTQDGSAQSAHADLVPESGAPQVHIDPPPESEAPPLHNDPPPESEAPPLHDDLAPADEFLKDGLKHIIRNYVVLGTIAGISTGLINGQKEIMGTVSPGVETVGGALASSDAVGRGASTHPRPRKKQISRGLASLRDKELRLLSVLTRTVLESLD